MHLMVNVVGQRKRFLRAMVITRVQETVRIALKGAPNNVKSGTRTVRSQIKGLLYEKNQTGDAGARRQILHRVPE